mmetsp:Transcript_7011/g.21342  ORF Transcript_7011/g.21342 Transcript_7011/m.21342 type:complete len:774 (-) Transcript_7011:163-2484(-)
MAFVFGGRLPVRPPWGGRGAAAAVCSAAQEGAELNARGRRQATGKRLKEVSRQIREELKDARRVSVKISIPYEVWKPLGLSPKLKLVRIFVDEQCTSSLREFQQQVRDQLVRLFPALGESNPKFNLLPDGNSFVLRHAAKQLLTDSDLKQAFRTVELLGTQLTLTALPKQIPQLNFPERVPEPDVVQRLCRNKCESVTVLSFYRFIDIDSPDFIVERLKRIFNALGVLGRIYVATEGINAQLCLPSNLYPFLRVSFMQSPTKNGEETDEIIPWAERWVPREVRGVFLNVDKNVPLVDAPFVDLRIKVRNQVLADGLSQPLNWSQNGEAVSPEKWHDSITRDDDVLVLDCRNKYESEVGRFENARALDTDTFRDSWNWLDKELENTNRDKKIMTYCTGGIRCVKVGAYLEQKLGFKNVQRLEGGIVAYSNFVRQNEGVESQFKGTNYVFDLRLGEKITPDVLTTCLNCGEPCDVQTDCANDRCSRPFASRHFVQCPECAAQLLGCCSNDCKQTLVEKGALSSSSVTESDHESSTSDDVDIVNMYSEEYSTNEPFLQSKLREETYKLFPSRAHMACGPIVGRLLRTVAKLMQSRRILELGTFTGYSTLWLADALPEDGRIVTCDIDEATQSLAKSYFERSDRGRQIDCRLAAASEVLEQYAEQNAEPFDLVFIDANKAKYVEYYDKILENNMVRRGGVIVVDNVLFKGGVPFLHDNEMESSTLSEKLRMRRTRSIHEANKLVRKMHEFNCHVAKDTRTEQLLLPIRDGVTVIRRL